MAASQAGAGVGRRYAFVVDVNHLETCGRFWGQVLGTEVLYRDDAYLRLEQPGARPALLLHKVPEDHAGKNRAHRDVDVTDLQTAVQRVQELGGQKLRAVHAYGMAWAVITDAPGNPRGFTPIYPERHVRAALCRTMPCCEPLRRAAAAPWVRSNRRGQDVAAWDAGKGAAEGARKGRLNFLSVIHGLGEICPRPIPFPQPMRFPNIPPFMQMAYDAFGASRVMWGSDFPPGAGREGYHNALSWTMEHLNCCSDEDQVWIFGKTALALFKFAA